MPGVRLIIVNDTVKYVNFTVVFRSTVEYTRYFTELLQSNVLPGSVAGDAGPITIQSRQSERVG